MLLMLQIVNLFKFADITISPRSLELIPLHNLSICLIWFVVNVFSIFCK